MFKNHILGYCVIYVQIPNMTLRFLELFTNIYPITKIQLEFGRPIYFNIQFFKNWSRDIGQYFIVTLFLYMQELKCRIVAKNKVYR